LQTRPNPSTSQMLRTGEFQTSSCMTLTLRQWDLATLSSEAGLRYDPMTRFKARRHLGEPCSLTREPLL